MDVEPQYAYLVLTIPFLIVWILLFALSKYTRKEQLIMSLLLIPAGIIGELFYTIDYWLPQSVLSTTIVSVPLLLEDILFAFAIGGIGAVIYDALLGKRVRKVRRDIRYSLGLPLVLLIALAVAVLLFLIGMNSIFASSLGFITAALLIVSQRRDLLTNSLVSGVSVMVIIFVAYIILAHTVINADALLQIGWLIYDMPFNVRVLGVPLTELIWGFSWGMLAGPIYEFAKRLHVV